MNIEIANRLVELRKKSGLSQEELAEKLGLSRQAVSKWERAESSPDTDNLICLAKLYGVSLDQLLSTDESIDEIVENSPAKKEESEAVVIKNSKVEIKDGKDHIVIGPSGISINGQKKIDREVEKNKKSKWYKGVGFIKVIAVPVLLLIQTALYIILGNMIDGYWAIGWTGYLHVFAIASILETIKTFKLKELTGAVVMESVSWYMFFGMILGNWHPSWAIFFSIPVYAIIADNIDKLTRAKRAEFFSFDDEDDDDEKDDEDDDQ